VREVVTGCEVTYSGDSSPDVRNYRVNCDKIARVLPAFQPQWTVRKGVEELYETYKHYGLTMDDFLGARYQRLKKVRQLLDSGDIDAGLRWRNPVRSAVAS
jgi:hypothetical protein